MKGIKEIPINEDELKLSLFAEFIIVDIKDYKDSPRKFLQPICTFRKVEEYKIMLELIVTVKNFLNRTLIVSFVHED